jgi:hypothetical protein
MQRVTFRQRVFKFNFTISVLYYARIPHVVPVPGKGVNCYRIVCFSVFEGMKFARVFGLFFLSCCFEKHGNT